MNLLRHIVNAGVLLTPAVNLREFIGHTAWSLQYSLVNAGSLWLKVSLAAAVLCLLWAPLSCPAPALSKGDGVSLRGPNGGTDQDCTRAS